MISPSYSLTATERVLPNMALDFTTAILDPRVTFTRAGNTATVINLSGVIAAINADLPRFDFDPTTLVCKGLLIEEARTNSLLNSLLDGTDLATQTVVVTAAARTLSFYGDGTIVLSGAHSATVVGNGAYPTRTTLTFTPLVGGLILTVTGTVQFAQLEAGAFATSFIPTDGTTKTRNADIATMTGTNFSDWFNASEGTLGAVFRSGLDLIGTRVAVIDDNTAANYIGILGSTGGGAGPFFSVNDTTTQCAIPSPTAMTANTVYSICGAYKVNNFAAAINGGAIATDAGGTIPSVNQMQIGRDALANYLNGWVRKIMYWPQRLTNAEVRAFSKG